MRANIVQRDKWTQIRIGACALLLPPLTLGAAFYSMLSTPEEGAARPPGTGAKAQVVRAELLRDTPQARAVDPDQQPAAETTQPIAFAAKPVPESGVSVSAAGTRHAVVAGPTEKAARVSNPVPVQVPSARANLPLPANMDSAPPGFSGPGAVAVRPRGSVNGASAARAQSVPSGTGAGTAAANGGHADGGHADAGRPGASRGRSASRRGRSGADREQICASGQSGESG